LWQAMSAWRRAGGGSGGGARGSPAARASSAATLRSAAAARSSRAASWASAIAGLLEMGPATAAGSEGDQPSGCCARARGFACSISRDSVSYRCAEEADARVQRRRRRPRHNHVNFTRVSAVSRRACTLARSSLSSALDTLLGGRAPAAHDAGPCARRSPLATRPSL
jgi:hypothetical protein